MSRYDGLIIPRSYSEYINKTDAATLSQALQLPNVMDSTPTEDSNRPVMSGGLYTALGEMFIHNIPRLVPKDITAYITDGTFWKRLAGTNGYALFEDIYVGDYFKMSRAISAYERTGQYQTTGSQYVTIAGLDTMMNNGDQGNGVDYHHAVMVPGQGFGGTQHFGRARMNATNTTKGGYKASEMNAEYSNLTFARKKIPEDGAFDADGIWQNCPLGQGVMDWAHLLPLLRAHNDSLCALREGVFPGMAQEECRIMHRWAEG